MQRLLRARQLPERHQGCQGRVCVSGRRPSSPPGRRPAMPRLQHGLRPAAVAVSAANEPEDAENQVIGKGVALKHAHSLHTCPAASLNPARLPDPSSLSCAGSCHLCRRRQRCCCCVRRRRCCPCPSQVPCCFHPPQAADLCRYRVGLLLLLPHPQQSYLHGPCHGG